MSLMYEKLLETIDIAAVTGGSEAQIGWVYDEGHWYFYNASGRMITGWLLDGGNWYYMNERGEMQTGWIEDKGRWYYFQPNGQLEGERY